VLARDPNRDTAAERALGKIDVLELHEGDTVTS
jgi:hypothetical protein